MSLLLFKEKAFFLKYPSFSIVYPVLPVRLNLYEKVGRPSALLCSAAGRLTLVRR
jgi:hypothetical protein